MIVPQTRFTMFFEKYYVRTQSGRRRGHGGPPSNRRHGLAVRRRAAAEQARVINIAGCLANTTVLTSRVTVLLADTGN
jgi:hypothetical protein